MYRCEDCGEVFAAPTIRTFREWLGEFYRPYTCEYCPACGSDVCETANGWFCRDKNCKFALWKENRFFQTLGKQMTEELAKQLVNQGKARLTHCYSKKSGRYYDTTVHVETGEDGAAAFKLEFGGKK